MSEEIIKKDLEVLWTVKQVAEYFSISPRTVYQWISGGQMFDPAKLVYVGPLVRIPRSEIERIANKKKDRIFKVKEEPKPKITAVPVTPAAPAPVAAVPAAPVAQPIPAEPIK